VQVGILRNPLEFRDAADVRRVRPDDVHRVGFDQLPEVVAEVDLLARVDRRGGGLRHIAVDIGLHIGRVVAGQHVF